MGPKNGGFATSKRHFLARNRVVWRILRQNRCTRLGCSLSQEPRQKSSRVTRGAKSRMRRTETPKPISIKFCMVVDIPDLLRGFWVAGVKFPPLPSTFIVAVTTLSHYRASVWCFIPLEMHVRLISAIKFYLLTYLLTYLFLGPISTELRIFTPENGFNIGRLESNRPLIAVVAI